jgi:hypothetical protein
MHVHLLNSKSLDPLSRQISLNKLEFCMLLLGELQAAYDSAGVFRGVFLEAIRRMSSDPTNRPTGVVNSTSNTALPFNSAASNNVSSGLSFDDGFFDELMDQGSISSFWDWVGSTTTEWNC